MSTLRSTYFAIARSIFPQSFRADRENVLFPHVEIWGVGARGHYSLPGKLVCGTEWKDKNEYGRGSLKLRGISAQILVSRGVLTGRNVLTVIWNNTSTGSLVAASVLMANEPNAQKLQCRLE